MKPENLAVEAPSDPSPRSLWDPGALQIAQDLAQHYRRSGMAPDHLSDAGLVVALGIARRHGVDDLFVLHNLREIVRDGERTYGWSGPYVLAMARRSGVFDGPIEFHSATAPGPRGITARARLHSGAVVDQTASALPQDADDDTLETLLCHRAAARLVGLYCPEVLSGLQPIDTVEDGEGLGCLPQLPEDPSPALPRATPLAPIEAEDLDLPRWRAALEQLGIEPWVVGWYLHQRGKPLPEEMSPDQLLATLQWLANRGGLPYLEQAEKGQRDYIRRCFFARWTRLKRTDADRHRLQEAWYGQPHRADIPLQTLVDSPRGIRWLRSVGQAEFEAEVTRAIGPRQRSEAA